MCSCPYITAVGGTRLYDNQTVLDPESALQADLGGDASLFASAGYVDSTVEHE